MRLWLLGTLSIPLSPIPVSIWTDVITLPNLSPLSTLNLVPTWDQVNSYSLISLAMQPLSHTFLENQDTELIFGVISWFFSTQPSLYSLNFLWLDASESLPTWTILWFCDPVFLPLESLSISCNFPSKVYVGRGFFTYFVLTFPEFLQTPNYISRT